MDEKEVVSEGQARSSVIRCGGLFDPFVGKEVEFKLDWRKAVFFSDVHGTKVEAKSREELRKRVGAEINRQEKERREYGYGTAGDDGREPSGPHEAVPA